MQTKKRDNKEEALLVLPTIVGLSLVDWWGKDEDQAVLIGVYHHGFGNTEAIRKDLSLIFSGFELQHVEESHHCCQ